MLVRVQGLAAVCPDCGGLVTPLPSQPQQPEIGINAAEETPRPVIPLETPPHVGFSRKRAAVIAILCFLGVAILIDYVRLKLRSDPTVVVSAPQPGSTISPPPQVEPTPVVVKESRQPTDRASQSSPTLVPSPAPPAPKPPPPKPTHPHAALADLRPVRRPIVSDEITDEQIAESIRRGVDSLIKRFAGTRLSGGDETDPETFAGRDALCVYALLHAGLSVADPRLDAHHEFMQGLIARLKEFPMDKDKATYSRSLRLSALAVANRPEDRAAIDADAKWLLQSSMQGAFTYTKPPADRTRASNNWDNSNSQYGALGIWAAEDAGITVPDKFWLDVENHWADTQTHTGGWGYGPGAVNATVSMTAAGVTSLFVARDLLNPAEAVAGALPLTKALSRGLEWLDEANHAIDLPGTRRGYALYGLERAGLASGYKYFGEHDWYTTLAKQTIALQDAEGSWNGTDGPAVETAFTLLFLSRGRHPVFISKLKFAGSWSNAPRDVANLTFFAGHELERSLNWQIVDVVRPWQGWTDCAVLYLASDRAAELTDADIDRLRSYIESGGLLFTHADRSSESFNRFAQQLASRLFPDRAFEPIPEDHPIYSSSYRIQNKPPLMGVSNGSRLLMVHSPADLARQWQRKVLKSNRAPSELAINIALYAWGRRELRQRVSGLNIPAPTEAPIGTVPVARFRYTGNWDPEPHAWARFGRMFERDTAIQLDVKPIDIAELTIETAPLAHLTGTDAISLKPEEFDALRQYLTLGGVLLIDPCGGSRAFADSIRQQTLPRLVPGASPVDLSEKSAILSGTRTGMVNVVPLKLRPWSAEQLGSSSAPPIQTLRVGKGEIIFSQVDLTSGLLGTTTLGITGYQPATAQALLKNIVLWSMQTPPR
ncbi:MAG: DUF4159 domain-containing protein [Tepidisphaeraceae bacterium]